MPYRATHGRRKLGIERCETRQCLSTVGFAETDLLTDPSAHMQQMSLSDIDMDGDLDLLAAFLEQEKSVWWYENVGDALTFSPPEPLLSRPDARFVQAVDLDGDGDRDLLVNVRNGFAWYENGGHVGYRTVHSIRFGGSDPVTADVDGDGDLDILHVSGRRGLFWRENVKFDGKTEFAPGLLINTFSRFETFALGDLDGDTDLDIVFVLGFQLWWHENLDGRGLFGSEQEITSPEEFYQDDVRLADIDSDDDLDIVTDTLEGHSNTTGEGDFGPRIEIAPRITNPSAFAMDDIDGDGDPDIILSNEIEGIVWLPNEEGTGRFGAPQTIDAEFEVATLLTGDVDGDGDVDIIAASKQGARIVLYESDLNDRLPGDTDRNGRVDFADFAELANNFGRSGAAWREGDFSGDGDVTFEDFLLLAEHFGQ